MSQKPVLFFAHAFPLNSDLWKAQISYFSKQYDVLAPDLRGHRDGPQDAAPWMIAHYAEDVKKLLEQKGIKKIHFCGNSMGGYVGLQIAVKYPELLASLTLADSRADADTNEAKDKRFALIQRLHKEGLKDFAPEFAKSALGASAQKQNPGLVDNVVKMIMTSKPEGVANAVGALASRHDNTQELAKFKMPVLVIAGEEDKVIPLDVQKKMADAIPKAIFEKIPNCGHFPSIEAPDEFNQKLEAFLASVKN